MYNFLMTMTDFSEIQKSILLIMIISEILLLIFYLFYIWELKSNKNLALCC